MASSTPRLSCADYHVAWISPLPKVELPPARLMLDEEHAERPEYDTHYDENTYIFGSIGAHNVVIAACPSGETGNVNAGRLCGPLFKTFPNIRLAFLVGIGGAIPQQVSEEPLENIHLGDVVVGWPGDGSAACVYHDRGKKRANGNVIVGTIKNPDWRVTNALGILESDHEFEKTNFKDQQARLAKGRFSKRFAHPGLEHDRLFKAKYHHEGEYRSGCSDCSKDEIIERPPRNEDTKTDLVFHCGRIATGNKVIQDGEERDRIGAMCDGAICVEMEAAGVDANRSCLIIRGISDYADSHKNDVWKSYAAGNAAAFTRELICRIPAGTVQKIEGAVEPEASWLVPFSRPPKFAGRKEHLERIYAHISKAGGQRLAVYGLGGCGKTALVLELVYRVREQQPSISIFWVSAVTRETFEQSYRDIGSLLHISMSAGSDPKQLVQRKLMDESTGQWLMVVDNADDAGILFEPLAEHDDKVRLIDFIPHSRKASIIFTTRTLGVASDLAGAAATNLMELGRLKETEARKMLEQRLIQHNLLENDQSVLDFLQTLQFLAIAIVQAVAFVNKKGVSLTEYVSIFRGSEESAIHLLSKDYEDQGRYRATKNPVAMTWYISFEQLRAQNPLAAEYLLFMACTTGKGIPVLLLPPAPSELEWTDAIGSLKAYAFITEQPWRRWKDDGEQEQLKVFGLHALVRLATQNWSKEQGVWDFRARQALTRVLHVLSTSRLGLNIASAYLPHAIHVSKFSNIQDAPDMNPLLDEIGRCQWDLGQDSLAERTYRRSVERYERSFGKKHQRTLRCICKLGIVITNQARYAEAETILRNVVSLQVQILGEEDVETLRTKRNLAAALYGQGKYIETERLLKEILPLQERALGEEHFDTLDCKHWIAKALQARGEYTEAEMIHREVIDLRTKKLEESDNLVENGKADIAVALMNQGKYGEAETMLKDILLRQLRNLGEEHPSTLFSKSMVAVAARKQGECVVAESLLREVIKDQCRVIGKDHNDTIRSMQHLADTFHDQKKYEDAEQLHREVLHMHSMLLGPDHPQAIDGFHGIAKALAAQGKHLEAAKIYEEQLPRMRNAFKETHLIMIQYVVGLAETREKLGKEEEACSLLKEYSPHWEAVEVSVGYWAQRGSELLHRLESKRVEPAVQQSITDVQRAESETRELEIVGHEDTEQGK